MRSLPIRNQSCVPTIDDILKAFGGRALSAANCGCRPWPLRLAAVLLVAIGFGVGSLCQAQTAHLSGYQVTTNITPTPASGHVPYEIAVDGSGNVFTIGAPGASDSLEVTEWSPSGGTYTSKVVVSNLPAYVGSTYGIAVDQSDNLYIGTTTELVKETLSGGVYAQSVIAPVSGNNLAVAVDLNGNVYVAALAYYGTGIVKYTPSAGSYQASGISVSPPIDGCYVAVVGPIAIDAGGNVYLGTTAHDGPCSGNNKYLIEESPSAGGYTQTQATPVPQIYYLDGFVITDTNGKLYTITTPTMLADQVTGSAVDTNGNIYTTGGANNGYIWKSTPYPVPSSGGNFGGVAVGATTGNIGFGTTSGGGPSIAAFASTAVSALFTFDSPGTLGQIVVATGSGPYGADFTYVSGSCHYYFSNVAADGQTCSVDLTFAPSTSGSRFGAVYLSDSSNNVLATGYVQGTGIASDAGMYPGTQSVGFNATANGLNQPSGMAIDAANDLYVADTANNQVVVPFVNLTVANGPSNGLSAPAGVAVDGSGSVLIADTGNNRVVKETLYTNTGLCLRSTCPPPIYTQSIVAGGLSQPAGVAVDGAGLVYIADTGNNRILLETPAASGYTQSVAVNTGLSIPTGIAVDGSGNLYIANAGSGVVLKETLSGGSYTQSTVASGLSGPAGVSLDPAGDVYVADAGNNRVLMEQFNGGGYTQTVIATGLNNPQSIIVNPNAVRSDRASGVYIADTGNQQVLQLDILDPQTLNFAATPVSGATTAQTLTLINIGNAPLQLVVPSTGSNPSLMASSSYGNSASAFTLTSGNCPAVSAGASGPALLAAGASCQMSFSFTPNALDPGFGNVEGDTFSILDNSLNEEYVADTAKQTANLIGTAEAAINTTTTLGSSLNPSTFGQLVTFTATVGPISGTTVPTGTVQFGVDGSTAGSPVSLSGGQATYPTSVLAAGTHNISAVYAPASGTAFTSSSAVALSQVVSQIVPTITWPTPAAIPYGMALSATQLNATANTDGTFVYSPVLGTLLAAGSQTLSVTFTPSDTLDYTTATASVMITVNASLPTATPVISLGSGTYDQPQSVTISDATPGAVIYYAINGTATTSSPIYSGSITVSSTETLQAIALASGYSVSGVASASYTDTVPATTSAGEWTWVGGSSTVGSAGGRSGIYGTLGVPATGNVPGSRNFPATWTDSSGNLWLFGGNTYDVNGNTGRINDLWEFNRTTDLWTWVSGSNTYGASGVYGTLGTASASNVPGGRSASAQWQDSSGNFWIFGGYGYDANGAASYLNDLWEFNTSTSQWTWRGGSNVHGQSGVYGTLGTASAANIPGSREEAMTWTDKSGNLWLFGGAGTDSTGSVGYLNDLWEFSPATGQWTWVGGGSVLGCTNCVGQATYGTLGTPAPGNIPGGRDGSAMWIDNGGNVWLFGGYASPAGGSVTELNDLWEFNPSTSLWTWIGGSNNPAGNQNGVYGTMGTAAPGNTPGGRDSMVNWTDANGNLWLFGGYGFNAAGGEGYLGDLWEFSPFTNEWTWMVGSNTNGTNSLNRSAVPGTLGVASASNFPGSRDRGNAWVDPSGNFWLFGGTGRDTSTSNKTLNDSWVYEPALGSLPAAATPAFTVTPGTYTSIQSVTINDATAGATIYYTTNGTAPTASSAVYGGGTITVSSTQTIEAIAIATGYSNSIVATAAYTILLPTATPAISLVSGTYDTPQSVTISDATPGAVIFYAINGTPTTGSTVYSGPITVSSTETLEAIALASGSSISGLATTSYTDTVPAATSPGEWTWVGENTTLKTNGAGYPGVFGTLGTPAPGNIPGDRNAETNWTDNSGNLWLFGGDGHDVNATFGRLNDVWVFHPSTNEWTWMGGSQTEDAPSVCGTLGTPATGNIPGARYGSNYWTDSSGNFWLFGGSGYDCNGNEGPLNDLWEFNPSTNLWAWVGGSSTNTHSGVYGGLGVPAAGNLPGSRENGVSWTDSSGNLWLFGGQGLDSTADTTKGYLNDLWEFSPSTGLWTWMSGSNIDGTVGTTVAAAPGVYGTLGVPAPGNVPEGRQNATAWTDSGGNFWLFGGQTTSGGVTFEFNDLWEYCPSTNLWTWMGGNSTPGSNGGHVGVYGSLGFASPANAPGSRYNAGSWIDGIGNLWLFGGEGFAAGGGPSNLSDLWEYSPSTNEWTWMGGPHTLAAAGVYGTLGTPSASNIPGGRYVGATWKDPRGNFWVFGGRGNDAGATFGYLNDLWEYQLPTTLTPAPTPTYSVGPGTYHSVQTVTISATAGATIYYTTNGTAPTINSPVYSSQITVSSTETLEAIAVVSGSSPSATATAAYTINLPVTPPITWATPAPITYGTTLSGTQLNASSPMGGSFVYSPAAGTVLTAGTQTLSVTFTPYDTTDYTTATTTVQLSVNQITPSITWATPAAVTYGTALSGTQLNASSPVGGSFVYSPAAGAVLTAGTQTLSVTFTPYDATDYTTATATVQLSVNQVTPSITWVAPAAIAYGTALNGTQLNANASVGGTYVYSPAAGAVLTAGTQALSVTFTPYDTTDYTTATATVPLTVTKSTPGITWSNPGAISYGTALSGTQLNASSGVAGTFTYTPPAGTVLGVGSQTLSVTFNPYDTADYTTATANATLVVNKATPAIAWATPAAITYGTALSATQLDASSPVGGSIVYSPAAGAVLAAGTQTLSVTLTPTDATDYTTATATVQLTVNKATPVIIWANPAAITYGTALSGTQLNATASVGGSFVYSPAAGTVVAGGSQALSVTFTPTNTTDYATATANVTLVVNPVAQTLTFPALSSPVTYGVSPITLSATASSGLAVTFSATGPATVSGNMLTISGAGAVVVTASQPGNADYLASNTVSRNLNVTKATPLAGVTPSETSGPYGTSVTLTATLTGAGVAPTGTVTFRNNGTSVGTGTLSGGVATLTTSTLPVGSDSITVSYSGDSNYVAATSAAAGVTVTQAAQTISFSAPSPVTYGVSPITLSAAATSGLAVTFSATGPATLNGSKLTITGVGTVVVTANQAGNADYSAAPAAVQSIIVNQATPTAVLTSGTNPAAYGGSVVLTATLTGSGVKPTGTVTFLNGTVTLGTATLSAGAVGKLTVATLPVGANSITASYAGDSNYTPVTSAPLIETVNQATPAVKFTALPHTVSYGASVALTATITGSGAAPTGTVTFLNGATILGMATLSGSGVATLAVTTLPVGVNSLSVNYGGDGNYAATPSTTVAVTVNPSTQTIAFTAPATPVVYGVAPVTLTATASSGLAVTFSATGPATVSGSTMTITGAGAVVVTANQPGNTDYAAANPVSKAITVTKATPSNTLSPSASSITHGSPITFTATLAGSGSQVVPTGTVTFRNGATALGTGTLNSSGVATYSTTTLTTGTHSITASYGGDTNYLTVTSSVVSITVTP